MTPCGLQFFIRPESIVDFRRSTEEVLAKDDGMVVGSVRDAPVFAAGEIAHGACVTQPFKKALQIVLINTCRRVRIRERDEGIAFMLGALVIHPNAPYFRALLKTASALATGNLNGPV